MIAYDITVFKCIWCLGDVTSNFGASMQTFKSDTDARNILQKCYYYQTLR